MSTKLRASCDACHFAKLKCLKTDQGCQRCRATGDHCSYSPALPRIYHKRRSRKSGSSMSESTPRATDKHSTSGNAASNTSIMGMPYSPPGVVRAGSLTNTSSSSTPANPEDGDYRIVDDCLNGMFWPCSSAESIMGSYVPETEPFDPGLWGPVDTPLNMIGTGTSISLGTAISSTSSLPPVPQPSMEHIKTSNHNDSSDAQPPSSITSQKHDSTVTCSCLVRLLNAMQRIVTHSDLCSPALDSVLCANRAATKQCLPGLQCVYGTVSSDNTSCVAIACGQLDRVLASYKDALDGFCAALEREDIDEGDMDEDENGERAFIQGTIRVGLGAFVVEKSEQVLCAREIVAREIEKLRTAVEGCTREDGNVRSVLMAHLMRRCSHLIDEIAK